MGCNRGLACTLPPPTQECFMGKSNFSGRRTIFVPRECYKKEKRGWEWLVMRAEYECPPQTSDGTLKRLLVQRTTAVLFLTRPLFNVESISWENGRKNSWSVSNFSFLSVEVLLFIVFWPVAYVTELLDTILEPSPSEFGVADTSFYKIQVHDSFSIYVFTLSNISSLAKFGLLDFLKCNC